VIGLNTKEMDMRKFLVGLVAAAALLVAPATSQAYLHQSTASSICDGWNDQSARSTIYAVRVIAIIYSGGAADPVYWNRISDSDVWISLQWVEVTGVRPRLAVDYVCHIVGSDSNWTVLQVGTNGAYWIYH
jgi:hypothetical protein